MSTYCYENKTFTAATLATIQQANAIVADYQAQGYTLTLRQLYYQFVARGLIENTERSYKRLGGIVSDARLAGLLDWQAIEDRTRNLASLGHWSDPGDIIHSAAAGYRLDIWAEQPNYVEVWVEKEALAGVVQRAAQALDVPFFCCRGYTSQSEMHEAAMRLLRRHRARQAIHIIHLGDHDPSGIDMSRDIQDRLGLFLRGHHAGGLAFTRIALNLDQVQQYNPPPNPAKVTDSRFGGYQDRYGDESWELDALDPATLHALIDTQVRALIEPTAWDEVHRRQERQRDLLSRAARDWDKVEAFLDGTEGDIQ